MNAWRAEGATPKRARAKAPRPTHGMLCAQCGSNFDSGSRLAKYCSPKCRNRAKYERILEDAPRCPVCGGPHLAEGKTPRPACNDCYRQGRTTGVDHRGEKVCNECGGVFVNGKSHSVAKCPPCRHRGMKARAALKGPCSVEWCGEPQFCRGWCNRHYWEQHAGLPFSTPVPCDECGDPLEYTRRVDDESGRRLHSRCKPRGARFIPDRERLAIYERDEYVCQICGGATVRRSGDWSPWEASLDHIVPRSSTLVPDHSPQNLRTCHSICNSLRGPGVMSDSEVVEKLREWEASNA